MGYFDVIDAPVTEVEPCGADLEGSNEFEFALEGVASRLPRSYFDFINPEKQLDLKPGFDLKDELAPLLGLLKKTRDIRLLVAAARLCILGGDLAGFADAISAMARLLATAWADVYPRAIDDDYGVRESHLSLLTDRATVLFPLQFVALDVSRRHGPLAYRAQMLALKLVTPRAKEAVLDEATIRDALVNSSTFEELKGKYATFRAIDSDLQAIRSAFIDNAGHEAAPEFGDLIATITPIREFLLGIIGERDPAAVPAAETVAEPGTAPEDTAPAVPRVDAFASAAQARAALAAIEAYFSTSEPSNPAALLVRQAQQLVGKSFIEAMLMVSPAMAEQAAIRIGGDKALVISADQMKALAEQGTRAPAQDTVASPAIATRGEALAQMEAVESFFQRNEPSSPIPLLLGRARSYSGRDFAALVKEMLPEA
jgi:type VI secretion system protein ImpA